MERKGSRKNERAATHQMYQCSRFRKDIARTAPVSGLACLSCECSLHSGAKILKLLLESHIEQLLLLIPAQ